MRSSKGSDPGSGGKRLSMNAVELREVEQDVDRHDDQHDQAEEQLPDRNRSTLEEVDDLVRVLADVVPADVADEPVAALLNVDAAEAMRVEPLLQPVDVAVRVDLAGSSVRVRKVGIDPIRGRFRLVDDNGPERPDGGDQCNREDEVHQRDCEAARKADRLDDPNQRVEQERDQQRDEEQEDDVTDRARHDPQEQQDQRQPDQLDPARDLHLRRPGGHVSDRTADVIRLRPSRPPDWDWDWAQDGNLALDRHEIWEESPTLGSGCRNRVGARKRQVRYGAADAGPRPPGLCGASACIPQAQAHASPCPEAHRPDRRDRRTARHAARDGVRPERDQGGLTGATGPVEPPAPGRPADAADGRPAQRPAHPAARRAEPRDGDRLPLLRRRRAAAEPARPAGERRRDLAPRAQDLRRRWRRLRLLPAERRRDRGARRRRRARHRRVRAGGRDDRRHLRLRPQRTGLRQAASTSSRRRRRRWSSR